jgi:hypothetical protein
MFTEIIIIIIIIIVSIIIIVCFISGKRILIMNSSMSNLLNITPHSNTVTMSVIIHLQTIKQCSQRCHQDVFWGRATRKCAYKLTFKQFTNISTEHPGAVGLYIGIKIWDIPFNFFKSDLFPNIQGEADTPPPPCCPRIFNT